MTDLLPELYKICIKLLVKNNKQMFQDMYCKYFWTCKVIANQIYDLLSRKIVLKIVEKQSQKCSERFLYCTDFGWQWWVRLWILWTVLSSCSLLDVPALRWSSLPWELQHLPLLRLSSSANLCTPSTWISVNKQTEPLRTRSQSQTRSQDVINF